MKHVRYTFLPTRLTATLTALSTLSIAASTLSGCGGADSAAPQAKAPSRETKDDDSIADLAAAQGGLPSLGGGGNREGGATGAEVAMRGPLAAEPVDPKTPVKLDGVLREWPLRSAAKETLSGNTGGLGLAVAVQYDDAKLYLGGEITDPNLVRGKAHGPGDDHVVMTLAFPAGRGAFKAYEIGFWPGKPGESTGVVRWLSGPNKGQSVAGAKIVEDDAKDGCTFEAALPWSTFPEARTMRVGLRAAFRYEDGDGSRTSGVLATGRGSVDRPVDLPPLPTASEQAVVDGLLTSKNLAGQAPKIDVFADVAGDERKERISVFGDFFTICGPGYRNGTQFFWKELGGELVSLETRDLGGRGKDDIVVRRRYPIDAAQHETLEVWSANKADEPGVIFAQEIEIASRDGKKRVTNAVHLGNKQIDVGVGSASGWDATTFHEPVAEGDSAILLPWGAVKSRSYRYDHGTFVKDGEVAQAGKPAVNAQSTAEPPLPRDLPSPTVRKGSNLSAQVLDAYYRDQKVAAGTKPRFDLEVHVDGDPRPERALLVGRDIVVFGPGFQGGTGYARMSLTQFASDEDVSEMTAKDLTGDGAADLVIRGVRHVDAPNVGKVAVDSLFVYQVKAGSIVRVFGVETGRSVGANRVQGVVQFVPSKTGKSFDVDLRPGIAKGWTPKTYPWPQEPSGGAIAPLLLPWGNVPNLRYGFDGTKFDTL